MSNLLDNIKYPADLRKLEAKQLKQLAEELRRETIAAVSETGGHLGAGLGVVELTVALHYVFNTPADRVIWDVGHQTYPHKILTGRRDKIRTIRQGGGLAGFTKRKESEYDPFGAGHSSTSISAGLGMAVARDLGKKENDVIAVIGDGAMSAGMAYEAMNNAGHLKSRLIVILNDNDMSIAPPVGAMSSYLTRLISSKPYLSMRDMAKSVIKTLPSILQNTVKSAERRAKEIVVDAMHGSNLFEEFGFQYLGPIDGHNIDSLVPILENVRNNKRNKPVLIHVITKKGHGYEPAESSSDKYHGVAKFDIATGKQKKNADAPATYTKIFAENLIKLAKKDKKIVAISAAMPGGTGLDLFAKKFPTRSFDVGIAEQHAVTFAAGLSCEGYKPFVAIYSTFLQRAYDQIVHDVALQNLPVRFIIDRAGLVGADGPSHAGSFDITYLATLPNFVIMAASDEAELSAMIVTAANYDKGPIALRFPRGEAQGLEVPKIIKPITIGKGKIINKGNDIAILSLGARLAEVKKAAEILAKDKINPTIVDMRFAKPLDKKLLREIAKTHKKIITIEEGAIGGFGSHVLEFLASENLLNNLQVKTMHLPDYFIDHNAPDLMYKEAGLDADAIVESVKS